MKEYLTQRTYFSFRKIRKLETPLGDKLYYINILNVSELYKKVK